MVHAQQGVDYRDLNLDKTGHVNITDGFSTLVSTTTSPRWTLRGGTHDYLAHDDILSDGHGVDWWAMPHEMCAGVAPYTLHWDAWEGRHLEIYEQIISTKLPDYFSMELVDMITGC